MTQRERRLVLGVFGWVGAIIGFVMNANLLVTGDFSTPLIVTFALVTLSSAPFVIPYLRQEWQDAKLTPPKSGNT